jgi:hypothetical protein
MSNSVWNERNIKDFLSLFGDTLNSRLLDESVFNISSLQGFGYDEITTNVILHQWNTECKNIQKKTPEKCIESVSNNMVSLTIKYY